MNFKEWMRITEERASTRNVPSSKGGYRPAMNQGFLRGSATTFGHTDAPDPIEKGLTSVATSVGSSLRKSLEDDTGLVVQGVGRILRPPGLGEKEPGVEYHFLPLQIPKYKYNNSYGIVKVTPNSDRIFKEVLDKVDSSLIRHANESREVDFNNKFSLLNQDEESGKWNWDPSEAKQFTTALIYKVILENMDPKNKESYELNSFEVLGEHEENGVLMVWFGFEMKKLPKKV